ncbi:MAG: LON peptidase substrate-binding domain-containing protein [Alphaproteobacteria bacterium]|nr:LON peptidase substrate-binding domain-containing protein [Alphaproteobacteria bacterium]
MRHENPFELNFERLPQTLPVFPLTGVLLLPRGKLPLNIFEPRYLNMTFDALAADRLIGMVQPTDGSGQPGLTPGQETDQPPVYETGCAGRITAFTETDDGRLLITLTGMIRFNVLGEFPSTGGYRRMEVDWSPYRDDLLHDEAVEIDRSRLLSRLPDYLKKNGLSANWEDIEQTDDEPLVTTLAMICPFEPSEKQALLECRDLIQRAELMTTLIEMAVLSGDEGESLPRH